MPVVLLIIYKIPVFWKICSKYRKNEIMINDYDLSNYLHNSTFPVTSTLNLYVQWLTQINWNSLKVLDKYLHENISCQKRAENIF